jgi:hypothetical protein
MELLNKKHRNIIIHPALKTFKGRNLPLSWLLCGKMHHFNKREAGQMLYS